MIEDYINNFENIASNILFHSFIGIVIVLTILLFISLILLGIGCLIKSQKLKSKFLKAVPSLFIAELFVLLIPYFVVLIRNKL